MSSAYVSLGISCLALALGVVNFYWNFLRRKKSLHVVLIEEITAGMMPQFAVLNGGKESVLITRLECAFVSDEGRSSFTPAQELDFKERESLYLPAGSGIHCKVRFTEPFTKGFAQTGDRRGEGPNFLYHHIMHLKISWADMDGTRHFKSVPLLRYGFAESGEIRSRGTEAKQVNLYKEKNKLAPWV